MPIFGTDHLGLVQSLPFAVNCIFHNGRVHIYGPKYVLFAENSSVTLFLGQDVTSYGRSKQKAWLYLLNTVYGGIWYSVH